MLLVLDESIYKDWDNTYQSALTNILVEIRHAIDESIMELSLTYIGIYLTAFIALAQKVQADSLALCRVRGFQ